MIIEICCDGIEAAKKAVEAGAKRIELCSDLSIGGITPPYFEIEEAAKLGTAVNVLVRPRGGDFVYNEVEIEKMLREIAYCGGAGVNGVVIGALTPEGKIDVPLCREFVSMARSYGLEITFHRAIDEAISKALSLVHGTEIPQSQESSQHIDHCSTVSFAPDSKNLYSPKSPQHIGPCSIHSLAHDFKNLQSSEELSPAALEAIKEVLEDVFNLGVDRILSSGGAPDAYAGRVVLGAMRRFAEEFRAPIIMAGGGVTPQNAPLILDAAGISELHGSRLSLLSLQ